MPVNQCVVLPMYSHEGMERKEFFKKIAGMGYPAVEIWKPGEDFEVLAEDAKSCGLKLISMVGHKESYDEGCLNNRANHDAIEADLSDSINIAASHGMCGLIVLSGNKIDGQDSEESIQACADILKRVAPLAEEKGINLNLELLNSKVNHPGYECDHTEWGVEVCKRAGSPRVKLLYDIYHMQIMEGDIIRTIRDNIEWIGHFHTAGNPGRNDFDDTQELNYTGICRAIADTGYELYVGHEFRPNGEVLPALENAYRICNC